MRLALVPRRQHVPDVAPWHVDSGSTTAYQSWVSKPLPSLFSAQVPAESKLGKKSFSVPTPARAGSPVAAHDETARRTVTIMRLDRVTLDNLRSGSWIWSGRRALAPRAKSPDYTPSRFDPCRGATPAVQRVCVTPGPVTRPVNGGGPRPLSSAA